MKSVNSLTLLQCVVQGLFFILERGRKLYTNAPLFTQINKLAEFSYQEIVALSLVYSSDNIYSVYRSNNPSQNTTEQWHLRN